MSEKVKLVIEISKPMYESVQNGTYCGILYEELKNGISLDEMTNWEALKSIFPYAEMVGGDEKLTAIRLDSNPKVGTPIALYTEWLNAPYSIKPKVRDI